MDASMSKLPTRMASRATIPPSEITAVSVVPPPTSTTMLPRGSWMGRPAPIAGAAGGLLDRPTLHLGDGRRHADQHPGPVETRHPGPLQQQPDHALGDVEIGDGALAEGADGHDVAGRPTDHLPGLVAHGQDFLVTGVQGDDGRLVQHDAPPP